MQNHPSDHDFPYSISSETEWQAAILHHNALLIPFFFVASEHPDRAIAFETSNFGWIMSARDPSTNRRTILAKF